MKREKQGLLLAVACLCCQVHGKSQVSFVDSPESSFLHTGQSKELVPGIGTVVSALLNTVPVSGIDALASTTVATLVKASPFEKPEAVAVLNIAEGPEGLPEVPHYAQTFEVNDSFGQSQAASIAVEGTEYTSLDISSLKGCGEMCMETMLQEALESITVDANYTKEPTAVFRGKILLGSLADSEACVLDLQKIADRLFAVELISTWRAVLNVIELRKSRVAQGLSAPQPQLLERSLLSLQAVSETYGKHSLQAKAAGQAIQKLLDFVIRTLQTGFDNRIVFIITTLDEEASSRLAKPTSNSLKQGTVPSRSLLQANAKGDSPQYTDSFIAWIAMWCTFFLLLFFALAGCHCLKNMRFKQDSLLYGKNKSD